ncbi:MAG TPA: hypothetical protein VFK05_35580, partial [Polyangiaceae bacterium]|nr:hypothetical protein [Polyangiaceae bacterium]
LVACAADPGTKPHDMSAAQHEAMAKNEDTEAASHAAQHDPNATETTTRCSGKGGCWTWTSNPTAEHNDEAQHHHQLAQKHRAASAALVEAEKSACSGLSDDDRDISPFAHREDIQSVSDYTEEAKAGRGTTTKVVGSTVVFRAVPGLTAEWLQRVVDCHLARAAAVGHDMPEMSYCPLMPKGAKAKVVSTGNGFAVDVFADDAPTIAEIKKRADALKGATAAK